MAIDSSDLHHLDFVAFLGGLQSVIPPDHPVLAALSGGRTAKVQSRSGVFLGFYGLAGSARAIGAARGFCYG